MRHFVFLAFQWHNFVKGLAANGVWSSCPSRSWSFCSTR
jgi:hypothetical protein